MAAKVVIAGCGNIGGFLISLLARDSRVTEITLIDSDRYSAENLLGQNIDLSHVGRFKTVVQAKLIRRIRKDISVRVFNCKLEDVPMGEFRSDITCSCLDSKIARINLAEIAHRLGVYFVDAGVLSSQSLARVSVYAAAEDQPCFECALSDDDYADVSVYPCQENKPLQYPTNAPAYLGSLAASIQASEVSKLLRGCVEDSLVCKQLTVGIGQHVHFISKLGRNPSCRFQHGVWNIDELQAINRRSRVGNILADSESSVSVFGARFSLATVCPSCQANVKALTLIRSTRPDSMICAKCGVMRQSLPFDTVACLKSSHLSSTDGSRSLGRVGIQVGDVITVSSSGQERHFLIAS